MDENRARAVRGRCRGVRPSISDVTTYKNGDGPLLDHQEIRPPLQPVSLPRQPRPVPRGRARALPPPQQCDAPVEQAIQKLRLDDSAPGPNGDAARIPPPSAEVSRGARRQCLIPGPLPTASGERRPTQGTKGTKERLKSNYFPFSQIADFTLHQYRVDFSPDPDVIRTKKALLGEHRGNLGRAYLFDGTILWSLDRIDEELERVSKIRKTEELVTIVLKFTRDLGPSDPEYVQFLNIILRRVVALMDFTMVNRDYYDPKNKIELPQHNIEIWPGYSTSIRQHEDGILLNVELGAKIMRRDTAYTLLEECRNRGRGFKNVFQEAITGTTVITPYNNKTYKIDDVDWDSNPDSTFDMKGTQVSFREYYKSKYCIEVGSSNQPLLVSNPSKRDIRAGRYTQAKLVPSTCNLTGLNDSMRANFTLMKAIATHTKVAPQDRISRIQSGFLASLTSKPETSAELNKWNIKFQPSVVEFDGRLLAPERIYLSGDTSFEADKSTGDFTQQLTRSRKPLLDAPKLDRWVVVYPKTMGDREVANFIGTLQRACSSFQFLISEPRYEGIPDDRGLTYSQSVENWVNQKAQLVMCIVPNNRIDRYDAIKKKCYVHRSIPNQVVLMKNVSKANMSVCSKIGIQLVCKMGGSPWTVNIPSWKNIMVAGFDVCHDTKQKEKAFGALVASLNDNQSRYASFCQPHQRGEEISPYMGMMMEKAVLSYKKLNGIVPTKIIFYRDGVGEGNFHHTMEQEVGQILKHLKKMYGDEEVPLVYIVVSKRINTRLFRAAGNSNPLPGTVADSCVTSPCLYDFFLVSQSVREGTVSPTSYVVLYDSIHIKPDVVQQLSYKLCHMYFNWSGTVRVPAPVQYAHKLAFLVSQHLHSVPQGAEQGMDSILYYL